MDWLIGTALTVLGVILGQFINLDLVKLIHARCVRPVLSITAPDNCLLRAEPTGQGPDGQSLDEKDYGFNVRNDGRSVANGVRFQLTKIEFRDKGSSRFLVSLDTSYALFVFNESSRARKDSEATIVPGGSVRVALAGWREGDDVIYPAISDSVYFHYDDVCRDAEEYRFTVVAFTDGAKSAKAVLTIRSDA